MDNVLHPTESSELRAHVERAFNARKDGMQLLRNRTTREYFATSKSQPGTLHRVTLLSCDCLGFVKYQHCCHNSALVIAHLLQESGAPLSTEQIAHIRTANGTRIGFTKANGSGVEAWGYSPEGTMMLLEQFHQADTDTLNRAADRVWRFYEAHHWAHPEDRRWRPSSAA